MGGILNEELDVVLTMGDVYGALICTTIESGHEIMNKINQAEVDALPVDPEFKNLREYVRSKGATDVQLMIYDNLPGIYINIYGRVIVGSRSLMRAEEREVGTIILSPKTPIGALLLLQKQKVITL